MNRRLVAVALAVLTGGTAAGANGVGRFVMRTGDLKPDGRAFQSFDGTAPVYHDGDDGLVHLDYAVWKAGQAGIKLASGPGGATSRRSPTMTRSPRRSVRPSRSTSTRRRPAGSPRSPSKVDSSSRPPAATSRSRRPQVSPVPPPRTTRSATGSPRRPTPAAITVTVKPDPAAAIPIASFEDGVDGWAPGSWQAGAGGVAQETDFATGGTRGLRVDSTTGAWFGAAFAAPLDLKVRPPDGRRGDGDEGGAAGGSLPHVVLGERGRRQHRDDRPEHAQ